MGAALRKRLVENICRDEDIKDNWLSVTMEVSAKTVNEACRRRQGYSLIPSWLPAVPDNRLKWGWIFLMKGCIYHQVMIKPTNLSTSIRPYRLLVLLYVVINLFGDDKGEIMAARYARLHIVYDNTMIYRVKHLRTVCKRLIASRLNFCFVHINYPAAFRKFWEYCFRVRQHNNIAFNRRKPAIFFYFSLLLIGNNNYGER